MWSVRLWSLYEQKPDGCHSNGIASVSHRPPTQDANTRDEYHYLLIGLLSFSQLPLSSERASLRFYARMYMNAILRKFRKSPGRLS